MIIGGCPALLDNLFFPLASSGHDAQRKAKAQLQNTLTGDLRLPGMPPPKTLSLRGFGKGDSFQKLPLLALGYGYFFFRIVKVNKVRIKPVNMVEVYQIRSA